MVAKTEITTFDILQDTTSAIEPILFQFDEQSKEIFNVQGHILKYNRSGENCFGSWKFEFNAITTYPNHCVTT